MERALGCAAGVRSLLSNKLEVCCQSTSIVPNGSWMYSFRHGYAFTFKLTQVLLACGRLMEEMDLQVNSSQNRV